MSAMHLRSRGSRRRDRRRRDVARPWTAASARAVLGRRWPSVEDVERGCGTTALERGRALDSIRRGVTRRVAPWRWGAVAQKEPSEGQSAGELLTQVSQAPRPGYTVPCRARGLQDSGCCPRMRRRDRAPDLVQISPDGRLSASVITPAAAASRVIVVARSTSAPTALDAGSFEPVWSADGQWLFHRQDTGLVRQRVRSAEPWCSNAPERLAGIMPVAGACGVPNYNISRDGSRVISVQRPAINTPSRVRFIQHYRPSAAPAPGHLVTLTNDGARPRCPSPRSCCRWPAPRPSISAICRTR